MLMEDIRKLDHLYPASIDLFKQFVKMKTLFILSSFPVFHPIWKSENILRILFITGTLYSLPPQYRLRSYTLPYTSLPDFPPTRQAAVMKILHCLTLLCCYVAHCRTLIQELPLIR